MYSKQELANADRLERFRALLASGNAYKIDADDIEFMLDLIDELHEELYD